MYGRQCSKETKLKMSIVKKRDAKCGIANHAWKGGISFEPYCNLFTKEFKERVREFWGRRCALCGKEEIELNRKLDIHHVTYNKETCCDDSKHLFVPLCASCHRKTNFNRECWKCKFEEMIYSKNIDGKCYYSEEEMEVFKNKEK